MASGLSSVRLRLAEVIERAENDEEFRKRLESNQEEVLQEYGIPAGTVEELSAQMREAQRQGGAGLRSPVDCVNTNGCADYTCFSSSCGPTCYVTIIVAAPDA